MSQTPFIHRLELRVRYSETDQMGTFYNSRALEWFECGRTELLRALGLSYRDMESKGLLLPVIEAHVQYRSRAQYDDLLILNTRVSRHGRASVRFDVAIARDNIPVADGYTLHAIVDPSGKPMRCPDWFDQIIKKASENP